MQAIPELKEARRLQCLASLAHERAEARARQGWLDTGCTVTEYRQAHYKVLSPQGRVLWAGEACCGLCARVKAFEEASVREMQGGAL